MQQRNKKNKPKNRRYFNHIESRAIKEQLKIFQENPNKTEYRNFSLGFYSIDFQENRVYQTEDPDNLEELYELEEVLSKKRDFRCDNSRNAANIAEPLKVGNKG